MGPIALTLIAGVLLVAGTIPAKNVSAGDEQTRRQIVTGIVTDESGRPVEGAVVQTFGAVNRRKAVADARGAYRLVGCEPREVALFASARGCATTKRILRIEPGMKPVDFRLPPGLSVRIRVVDDKGRPVPNARIFLQPFSLYEIDGLKPFTDEDGRWEWNEAPREEFVADITPPDGMQLQWQRVVARKEEYVFRVSPALVISGNVIDAQTKQPIKQFRVVRGVIWKEPKTGWDWANGFVAFDGRYSLRETEAHDAWRVRIEADGYLPVESRHIQSHEGKVTVDFKLAKGTGISGSVLTPDGGPAAEAKVVCGAGGSRIRIKDGDFEDFLQTRARDQTDGGGQFHLPPENGDFWLAVTHPSGYAEIKCAPKSRPRIRLTAWARLEGTYRAQGKLRANAHVSIARGGTDQNLPSFLSWHDRTTDANGRFVFERVIPGMQWFNGPPLDESANEMGCHASVGVDCQPGKTARLDFGASGRPVVGELRWQPDAKHKDPWNRCLISVHPDHPLPPRDKDAHFDATIRGGCFSIDAVPSGNYVLEVYAESSGHILKQPFTVSAVDEKSPRKPFELGMLTLGAAKGK
jgi:protocatechuate 3,4-dioxygenase beta subunit